MKKYLYPTNILLPKKDYEKWAVIACDQYTSDSAYWQTVEKTVGEAPSALNIILPEIYLEETEDRVEKINSTMKNYLDSDVFETYNDSFVYVEREITGGHIRHGVVGMIDLTEYDYNAGSSALCRATEQTVAERIPPRVAIRRGAPLEIPHVMVFINDPENSVLGQLSKKKNELSKIYDFNLMQNGGHIEGYRVVGDDCDKVNQALCALVDNGFLYAVGDGNHSLATAKECYRLNPTEQNRYALVEIVNIYNEAIEFEPIYRVLFNCDEEHLLAEFEKSVGFCENGGHEFKVVTKNGAKTIYANPTAELPVGTLQAFLDDYLKENPTVKIDYIHGISDTEKLCEGENTVGFIFDGMKKDELFSAVAADGSLPRKTFSMGHADDKRFYIEARKL
ncbi:MAG: DUF1015 domain-containing protein [Clostridia bacterium]|nr:DUF1015 domain-containing protein [Clostridia bacterium]